jgi:hypothetical protein
LGLIRGKFFSVYGSFANGKGKRYDMKAFNNAEQ